MRIKRGRDDEIINTEQYRNTLSNSWRRRGRRGHGSGRSHPSHHRSSIVHIAFYLFFLSRGKTQKKTSDLGTNTSSFIVVRMTLTQHTTVTEWTVWLMVAQKWPRKLANKIHLRRRIQFPFIIIDMCESCFNHSTRSRNMKMHKTDSDGRLEYDSWFKLCYFDDAMITLLFLASPACFWHLNHLLLWHIYGVQQANSVEILPLLLLLPPNIPFYSPADRILAHPTTAPISSITSILVKENCNHLNQQQSPSAFIFSAMIGVKILFRRNRFKLNSTFSIALIAQLRVVTHQWNGVTQNPVP